MFSTYRAILERPGTLAFSAAALLARLPLSMVGLGIVLLVSSQTGSYALGGAVSAAYLVANAVFSILQGRLLDRLGQRPVLVVAVWVFSTALLVMALSVQWDGPRVVTFVAAAVAGATMPTVGSCVRARWSHVLERPAEVQTAYALEAVLDEVVFVTGPILVTFLATSWHPLSGVGVAVAAALVGTLAFAAQRGTEPPAHGRRHAAADRPPMPWGQMLAIALVCVALGTLFGGAEVATVAFAEEQGDTRWAGPLLAIWSFASLLAGVATGVVGWRRGPGARLRFGTLGMAAAMAPLPFIGSLWVMAVALFLGGFAIAPSLIAATTLTEQVVPRTRLVEGMAIVHTGLAGGVAPGAALAGLLVDSHGASAAYFIALAGGVVAALGALLTPRSTP